LLLLLHVERPRRLVVLGVLRLPPVSRSRLHGQRPRVALVEFADHPRKGRGDCVVEQGKARSRLISKAEVVQELQTKEDWLFDNWDCLTLESIDEASAKLDAIWATKSERYTAHTAEKEAREAEEEAKRVAERVAEEAAAGPQDYDTR